MKGRGRSIVNSVLKEHMLILPWTLASELFRSGGLRRAMMISLFNQNQLQGRKILRTRHRP